jgi:polyhydroxyalkanoate synthase
VNERSGKMVKARTPGNGPFKPIEDAPGSYVKRKGE